MPIQGSIRGDPPPPFWSILVKPSPPPPDSNSLSILIRYLIPRRPRRQSNWNKGQTRTELKTRRKRSNLDNCELMDIERKWRVFLFLFWRGAADGNIGLFALQSTSSNHNRYVILYWLEFQQTTELPLNLTQAISWGWKSRWSSIQVLFSLDVAELQWLYRNWCVQRDSYKVSFEDFWLVGSGKYFLPDL